MNSASLEKYCELWNLKNPRLLSSLGVRQVFKVQFQGGPAALKLTNGVDPLTNEALALTCFGGSGSARLLKNEREALLLEFADGPRLSEVLLKEGEDPALEILSETITRLHSAEGPVLPALPSMKENFRPLFRKAQTEPPDSIYIEAAKLAQNLLDEQKNQTVLHGDIHYDNVLLSSERGWLAIDPKGLVGESAYEVSNIFYNPREWPTDKLISVIEHKSFSLSRSLKIDFRKILQYAFVFGCLSACWSLEDGEEGAARKTLWVANGIKDLLDGA